MSALWLRLITILSVACTALSGSSGLVWRDIGGSITIQCRTSEQDQEALGVEWGLHKEDQVLFWERESERPKTIKKEIKHRVETKGKFPELDIVITNLTVEDTGAYWCVYRKFDKNSKNILTKGDGSVLLVVKGAAQQCNPLSNTLILVCVLTSGIVLLGTFIVLFIWIILKIKAMRTTTKPRQVTTGDVYEDMRATLRR